MTQPSSSYVAGDNIPSTPDEVISECIQVSHARFEESQQVLAEGDRLKHYYNVEIRIGEMQTAFLMELLKRLAPDVASRAAQILHDINDSGDGDELMGEWQAALAESRPLDEAVFIFRYALEGLDSE